LIKILGNMLGNFNKTGVSTEETELVEKATDSHLKTSDFPNEKELALQSGDLEKYLKIYENIPCLDTYILGTDEHVDPIVPNYEKKHPEKFNKLKRNAIVKSILYLRGKNYDSKDDKIHVKELIYLLHSINKVEFANNILDKIKNVEKQKKEEWITNRKQESKTLDKKLRAEFKKKYDSTFEQFNEKTKQGLNEFDYTLRALDELYSNSRTGAK